MVSRRRVSPRAGGVPGGHPVLHLVGPHGDVVERVRVRRRVVAAVHRRPRRHLAVAPVQRVDVVPAVAAGPYGLDGPAEDAGLGRPHARAHLLQRRALVPRRDVAVEDLARVADGLHVLGGGVEVDVLDRGRVVVAAPDALVGHARLRVDLLLRDAHLLLPRLLVHLLRHGLGMERDEAVPVQVHAVVPARHRQVLAVGRVLDHPRLLRRRLVGLRRVRGAGQRE
mmetsp:Transcript_6422/g.20403  ORF Transcript_6422/g.20403 Transcript_6422/m.20403 type:complete len:225 (-) Transcript_6422:481-1155(-)